MLLVNIMCAQFLVSVVIGGQAVWSKLAVHNYVLDSHKCILGSIQAMGEEQLNRLPTSATRRTTQASCESAMEILYTSSAKKKNIMLYNIFFIPYTDHTIPFHTILAINAVRAQPN